MYLLVHMYNTSHQLFICGKSDMKFLIDGICIFGVVNCNLEWVGMKLRSILNHTRA